MAANGAFVPKLLNIQNNDMVLYDSSIGQWKNVPVSLAPSVLPSIASGSILGNSSNVAATAAAISNHDLRSKLVSDVFYISSSGSDTNIGTDPSYPFLTTAPALTISNLTSGSFRFVFAASDTPYTLDLSQLNQDSHYVFANVNSSAGLPDWTNDLETGTFTATPTVIDNGAGTVVGMSMPISGHASASYEIAGCAVKVTSGAAINNIYLVSHVTANKLICLTNGAASSIVNGDTFTLFRPSVILSITGSMNYLGNSVNRTVSFVDVEISMASPGLSISPSNCDMLFRFSRLTTNNQSGFAINPSFDSTFTFDNSTVNLYNGGYMQTGTSGSPTAFAIYQSAVVADSVQQFNSSQLEITYSIVTNLTANLTPMYLYCLSSMIIAEMDLFFFQPSTMAYSLVANSSNYGRTTSQQTMYVYQGIINIIQSKFVSFGGAGPSQYTYLTDYGYSILSGLNTMQVDNTNTAMILVRQGSSTFITGNLAFTSTTSGSNIAVTDGSTVNLINPTVSGSGTTSYNISLTGASTVYFYNNFPYTSGTFGVMVDNDAGISYSAGTLAGWSYPQRYTSGQAPTTSHPGLVPTLQGTSSYFLNGTGAWSIPSSGTNTFTFTTNGTILTSYDTVFAASATTQLALPASASAISGKYIRIKNNTASALTIIVGTSEANKITDLTSTVVSSTTIFPSASASFVWDTTSSTYQMMNV